MMSWRDFEYGSYAVWRKTLACVMALLVMTWPAMADQRDARLDDLFTELRTSQSLGAALSVERQIWAIWSEVDGDAVPVPHFGAVLDLPAWRRFCLRWALSRGPAR